MEVVKKSGWIYLENLNIPGALWNRRWACSSCSISITIESRFRVKVLLLWEAIYEAVKNLHWSMGSQFLFLCIYPHTYGSSRPNGVLNWASFFTWMYNDMVFVNFVIAHRWAYKGFLSVIIGLPRGCSTYLRVFSFADSIVVKSQKIKLPGLNTILLFRPA